MAEFSQKRGKRRGDEGLGSVVDFLLANARLVLGVGGAAVLGIATLAVKRFIDRATSPRDEDDTKGDSWKELSLLKSTPHLQPRPPPAAPSQPVLPLIPSPSAPGKWHSFPSHRQSPGSALTSLLLSGLRAPQTKVAVL
uniref:Mitochondrial elongation factor 2 n=1 Tax=Saimiri boliviensis boliviensis TaxID=39432 RepID=A0A2K6UL74_SAIBB